MALGVFRAVSLPSVEITRSRRDVRNCQTERTTPASRVGILLGPLIATALLAATASFVAGFRHVLLVGVGFCVVATIVQHALYAELNSLGSSFNKARRFTIDFARDTPIMPATLRCSVCGTEYEDRWRCVCGSPLDYANPPRPTSPAPTLTVADTRNGLWAFEDFLPMNTHATLGEGFTPLIEAPERNATFKLEYIFPTGSFKDRGATTTVSRAVECGVETVVDDSSGNAGAAIATYAARAGIDAEVYVPASVKDAKLKAIERAGATPVRVEGTRQDVTDACVAAVEEGTAWYASHAWNPAFFAGTATFAYEVAAQRDWEVPDTVVTPLGHGTLFLGAYRGFCALYEAGWTDSIPRMFGAQATGVSPIADELHGEQTGRNDVADGIQIENPVRKDQILDAIETTNGDAIAVDATETESELESLHQRGFYTEPTSPVAPVALRTYRERGCIDDGDSVVVALSGSGLKM